MREEYLGIVDAGFILQVDDPWLIDTLGDPARSVEERDAGRQRPTSRPLNHALRGHPRRIAIRHHTCYGLNHGPRLTDIAAARRGAVHAARSTPAPTRSRWPTRGTCTSGAIWEDVELPDGKILIPGLLGHANNYVEHPELIAEYIVQLRRPRRHART